MKPIIMSAESVRAILGGRKTQTRRVIKPQPWWIEPPTLDGDQWIGPYTNDGNVSNGTYAARCPYPIGSRLWVRETWCPYADDMTREYCQTHDPEWGEPIKPAVYSADYDMGCNPLDVGGCEKWSSPVTMPRWASRITLEVTSTSAGRVQGENGLLPVARLLREGFEPYGDGTMSSRYIAQWNADNPKYPWDSNPWVWVVEFAVAGGDR